MFEIANHRLFRVRQPPARAVRRAGRVSIHAVSEEGAEVLAERRLPHGTLITDQRVAQLAGETGRPIDLELEIYHLEVEQMPAIQVSRLRDLAGVLERLNTCGSRHEAVYLLRFLVARFCSTSYRGIASAKNLMPEITRVRNELIDFMNGPFAERLRLPTRILVRSISGMVSRPKLIDEVWQDTIDLAEVQVRGSTIANEIRRSTHHAMGKQTLQAGADLPGLAADRPGGVSGPAARDPDGGGRGSPQRRQGVATGRPNRRPTSNNCWALRESRRASRSGAKATPANCCAASRPIRSTRNSNRWWPTVYGPTIAGCISTACAAWPARLATGAGQTTLGCLSRKA